MHRIVIGLWLLAAVIAAVWFHPDYLSAAPVFIGAVAGWTLSFMQRIFGGYDD